jgi:hypothetical protein
MRHAKLRPSTSHNKQQLTDVNANNQYISLLSSSSSPAIIRTSSISDLQQARSMLRTHAEQMQEQLALNTMKIQYETNISTLQSMHEQQYKTLQQSSNQQIESLKTMYNKQKINDEQTISLLHNSVKIIYNN